jgi:hypothetical protein
MPDDGYINRTIDSARAHLFAAGWISSPLGGYPRKRDAMYRRATTTGADVASLALARGQSVTAWIAEIQDLGLSRATAYRLMHRLCSDGAAEIVDGRIFSVSSRPAV